MPRHHVHANPLRLAQTLAEPTDSQRIFASISQARELSGKSNDNPPRGHLFNFQQFIAVCSQSITRQHHGRRSRYLADAQVHPQPSACPETDGRVRIFLPVLLGVWI